ncbi:DUF6115 domain-containing protein [Brevibacillus sp. SYSU BS000544]|uniref:DUF6115 domain-containing protein n=1 Tax=Brevibacillus sp. SYSU BS000544 TaxID=3416443 RepID=UPI003CE4EAED
MDQPLFLLFGAGALIVISAFFLRKKETVDKQPVIHNALDRSEMEKTLQRFVLQVQKENDQTIQQIQQNKQEHTREVNQLHQRLHQVEAELNQLKATTATLQAVPKATVEEIAEEVVQDQEQEEDSFSLRERYKRVFDLKQEGLHPDEIAKKLGAGRGEIDLILSLASPAKRGSSDDKS